MIHRFLDLKYDLEFIDLPASLPSTSLDSALIISHHSYVPGDEIILIGFSRGAFTVRSVAAMISDIGLLTRAGMAVFYPM